MIGGRHPGVVLGRIEEGERAVAARGGVSEDAIFEIGSITKVFTALLLGVMAEEGVLCLDDQAVPNQPFTLAELASHTAGLPRLPAGLRARALRERRDPYATFDARDLDAAVATARPRRRGHVRYSNFGAGLLGQLLASRAATSWKVLIAERICAPLGLCDTSVQVPEGKRHRLVNGHTRWGRPTPHWHFDALAGCGALHSTVGDMLTFLAFQLAPGDDTLGAAAQRTQQTFAGNGSVLAGLGWLRSPRGSEVDMLWHNGGTGGFRSFVGFVPERQAAVVVLSDCNRSVDSLAVRTLQTIAA